MVQCFTGLGSHWAHILQKCEGDLAFFLSLRCVFEAIIGCWDELLTIHLEFNIPKRRLERTSCYFCLKTGGLACVVDILKHSVRKTENSGTGTKNYNSPRTFLELEEEGSKTWNLKRVKANSVSEKARRTSFILSPKHPFCFDGAKSPRWEETGQQLKGNHSSIYFSITTQMRLDFFWVGASFYRR